VSNPDLPGPYWQNQDNAGYGNAWRGRPSGAPGSDSPWDDGAGFWRGGEAGSRSAAGPGGRAGQDDHLSWGERARLSRGSRRSARGSAGAAEQAAGAEFPGPGAAAPRSRRNGARHNGSRHNGSRHNGSRDDGLLDGGSRHSGHADDWAAADYGEADYGPADYGRRSGRRGYPDPEAAGERTGRFSQTADDLRSRLGLRGSAVGRGKRGLGATGAADYDQDDLDLAPAAGMAARADRGGYRGSRRAGGTAAAAGFGDYGGPGGYDDGRASSRTALHDQPDGWPGDYRRGRGTGTTQRIGGGGRGGGRGGHGGRGGGGWDGDDQAPRNFRERIRHSLRTGRWWRHWTWKKVLGVLGGAFAAFVLLCILGFFIIYSMTPIRSAADQQALWQSSSVYFSNGKLLGTFANNGQSRQVLTTAQIPRVMNQAMVAAEDRHFYTEGGISISGIFRAAYQDLFGSGGLQGGSTITEQYAKNSYASIGTSQSITTKIKEIFVAIKLAHARSKDWIMTQYLNIVPFGPQTYGVGAAAQQYFGVNLANPGAKLTVAQAAMLASMPNAPGVFNPDPGAGADFTALVSRWQYVLNGMATDHAISQQQANLLCANCALGGPQAQKAFEKNVKIVSAGLNSGGSGYRGYLMNMVESELQAKYGLTQTQIQTSGLKITTTFNPSLLTQLNHAVYLNVKQMKIDASQGNGHPLPAYAHAGAALIDPKTGGILAIYGGPGILSPKACAKVLCWDNTAEIPHQPGSSFKPYVLATAISEGMNAKTSVMNAYSPICVPPDTMQFQLSARISLAACSSKEPLGYWPGTDSSSLGGIPVAEAAAISSNPGFEDLAHRVGIENVIQKAAKFGIGSTPYLTFAGGNDLTGPNGLQKTFGTGGQHPGSVTMSLGASGTDVTAIEQASTFATLADDGIYHLPHVISSISGGLKPITVTIPSHQVLSATQAADEDYALSFDNQPTYSADGATGYPAAYWGTRPVIAKTGTTDTAQSAWFIGAIPQYALAVTLYTNQQCSQTTSACYQTLNNLPQPANSYLGGGFGGAWPATIWHTFMTTAFANLPVAQLPTTDFGPSFVKWNQVPPKPKHKATCGQGQGGQGNGNGHGKKCKGCQQGAFGQPCGGNPSPTPTCGGGFGQPCSPSPTPTSSSPSPTPTCGHGTGQPCSPSPTPTSPSPSPSCSQVIGPPCQPSPGAQGAASPRQPAVTAAQIRLTAAMTPQQLAIEIHQALLGQRL
jgi:membrane peptidoglycan carboxypeptidase